MAVVTLVLLPVLFRSATEGLTAVYAGRGKHGSQGGKEEGRKVLSGVGGVFRPAAERLRGAPTTGHRSGYKTPQVKVILALEICQVPRGRVFTTAFPFRGAPSNYRNGKVRTVPIAVSLEGIRSGAAGEGGNSRGLANGLVVKTSYRAIPIGTKRGESQAVSEGRQEAAVSIWRGGEGSKEVGVLVFAATYFFRGSGGAVFRRVWTPIWRGMASSSFLSRRHVRTIGGDSRASVSCAASHGGSV